jgi:hypothetical protein
LLSGLGCRWIGKPLGTLSTLPALNRSLAAIKHFETRFAAQPRLKILFGKNSQTSDRVPQIYFVL